uniref:Cytochrome P450 n=1 Tax=Glossina palpalis gambiensis TaxID=67801 RepID=A0A1B0B3B9_9MUSC
MLLVPVILLSAVFILFVGLYTRMLFNHLRKVKIVKVTSNTGERFVEEYKQAPGPLPWPIIGNLHLLLRFSFPFDAFTQLSKELGDIYSLTIGSTRCLVVNNLDVMKEVLNQNGKFFGGRPDFLRYHKLFGGDRNNSLALCDWSPLQEKRRNLARSHCSPREPTSHFKKMSDVGCFEIDEFVSKLNGEIDKGGELEIKPILQQTCANMFSHYMCSVRFEYDDKDFQKVVECFDEIFWEINQGCPHDFFPSLAPFYRKHTTTIVNWSATIRCFILQRIMHEREINIDSEESERHERDFTDAIINNLAESENVTHDTVLFMLEDFIGGHSAVGNLVLLALGHVAKNRLIGERIQEEVDDICETANRKISLYDMARMPYTMATIYEVLRHSSSPIVPHVATDDVVISGYGVTKGTVVFINNYKLNTSSELWENPEIFDPERFLERTSQTKAQKSVGKSFSIRRNSEGSDSGVELEKAGKSSATNLIQKQQKAEKTDAGKERARLKANIPHFIPFSIGKRTCIGQNLLRRFAFILLANILQRYEVSSRNVSAITTRPACVALPVKTYPLVFTPRARIK